MTVFIFKLLDPCRTFFRPLNACFSRYLINKRSILSQILVAAVLCSAGVSSTLADEALSLQSALQISESRSQALFAQQQSVIAENEMAVSAAQLPDPFLDLALNNTPVEGSQKFDLNDDFMSMQSVGIMQTFVRKDKRQARADTYLRSASTASALKDRMLLELRRDTANAWFDKYFQAQMLQLLKQQRQEIDLEVNAAQASYSSGKTIQADIIQLHVNAAKLDDAISNAQAQLEIASINLGRWVGEQQHQNLAELPDIRSTKMSAHSSKESLEHHPHIKMMRAKEQQAQAEAELARQDKHSDWNVRLNYAYRDEFSDMLSVGVSVPLQINQDNNQNRKLAAKLAKVEQARAQREESIRDHFAETQRWLSQWRQNVQRLDNYKKTILPMTLEQTKSTLRAYSAGEAELKQVMVARQNEIRLRLDQLRLTMETARLWVELENTIIDESAHASAQQGVNSSELNLNINHDKDFNYKFDKNSQENKDDADIMNNKRKEVEIVEIQS